MQRGPPPSPTTRERFRDDSGLGFIPLGRQRIFPQRSEMKWLLSPSGHLQAAQGPAGKGAGAPAPPQTLPAGDRGAQGTATGGA